MHTGGEFTLPVRQHTPIVVNPILNDSQMTGQFTDGIPAHSAAVRVGLASFTPVDVAPPDPERRVTPDHFPVPDNNETFEKIDIRTQENNETDRKTSDTPPTERDDIDLISLSPLIEITQLELQPLTNPFGEIKNGIQRKTEAITHNQTKDSTVGVTSRTMPTSGEIPGSSDHLQSTINGAGADDNASFASFSELIPVHSLAHTPNNDAEIGRDTMEGQHGGHPPS